MTWVAANAGRRVMDGMRTLPAAGSVGLRLALNGPVPERPAAASKTLAPIALTVRAVVARRLGGANLAAVLHRMFFITFRSGLRQTTE